MELPVGYGLAGSFLFLKKRTLGLEMIVSNFAKQFNSAINKIQLPMETPPSERSVDIEKYKIIRERWDKEDTLLLSRTGIFLTSNSLLFSAMRFQESALSLQIGVAIFGLVLSALWLTTSLHSFNVIGKLFFLSKDDMPHELKEIYKIKRPFLRPNDVFCKWIPGLIITGWMMFIVWLLASL